MTEIYDELNGTVKTNKAGRLVVEVSYQDCDYTPDGYDNETCMINGIPAVVEFAGKPFGFKTDQKIYMYIALADADKFSVEAN